MTFLRVAPVVPVRDLDAALDRYRRLGFEVWAYVGGARYGFVDQDEVSLHLTKWAEHDPARSGSAVYLYVRTPTPSTPSGLPQSGRLHQPRDTEYGLREFTFVDSDGTLLRVGSSRTPA